MFQRVVFQEDVFQVGPLPRDPYMDPFDPRSPYKRPIGNDAVYEPVQSPVFIPGSLVNINVLTYSKNIWLASSSDPMTPLYHSNFPLPGIHTLQWVVRVPVNAVPNFGTDGHMMVVDEDKVLVYESGVVRQFADGWRGENWHPNNIRESGIYPVFHGSGAWGNCAMGGIIRAGEPENGFHHALAGTLSNSAYHGPGHVWPANSQDKNLGTTGNVYIGSLLAIPPWVDLDALGITDPRARTIAQCLQDYGVYLTGSGDVFSGIVFNGNGVEAAQLRFPPRVNGSDFSHPFWHGMSLATAQLQVVTSNLESVPADQGAGGGTPRVPFSAEFDNDLTSGEA